MRFRGAPSLNFIVVAILRGRRPARPVSYQNTWLPSNRYLLKQTSSLNIGQVMQQTRSFAARGGGGATSVLLWSWQNYTFVDLVAQSTS